MGALRALPFVVLAAATTATSIASAQVTADPPAAPQTRRVRDGLAGEALAAFDRGSTLFEDGDYRGARAEFERAHDLAHDPRVLYNVAVCDKMLRRYTRAIESLERSLREGGTKLPADYVKRTRATIAALAPYVSLLVVSSDEAGATVLVDGEPLGTTPLAGPLSVEVGEHLVSLRKPGFLDVPQRVRVNGGETATASFRLESTTSRAELAIEVTGSPPATRVTVLLDGVEIGTAPLRTFVERGPHTVAARAAGFGAAPRRVEVNGREPVTLTLTLERESRMGRVRVHTDEDTDVVELDGRDVGHGAIEETVSAGEHRLRVKRSGAEPRSLDFVINENETRSFTLSLSKKPAVPTWLLVGGGALLAGGATVAIVLLTRRTDYQGNAPGTLPPSVLPAGFTFGGTR